MTTTATKLDITVHTDEPVISYRRFVKAPPALVFRAWTDPDALRQWMGPRVLEMVACEMDVRVGGAYRFVSRAPDGQEYGFSGEYREISPPHRLVSTFIFDGMPEDVVVETLELQDVEGGTLLVGHSRHVSFEARDAHLANGMEYGMNESMERLDEWTARELA